MIHYLTLAGRWMFSEYLEYWGRELDSRIRILRYEALLDETRFEPGVYVFSTIDEVPLAMGRYIDELASQLRSAPGVRILNDPAQVVRRFDLHQELHGRGKNWFRSFRASGDTTGMRYPVFIRSEKSHDGALSPLLQSPKEVEIWMGRALALGRPLEDLMLVEFCDTADVGGWYRKYAAFHVEGEIVPRSLNYGREWMLKFAGNEFSQAMAEEEREYVRTNPHEKELREIFDVARTDYGRIDYSIRDGQVQTWEINLNPTIGRGLRKSSRAIAEEVRDTREETKQLFYSKFNAAWAAVAARSGRGGSTLEIRVDPKILLPAKAEERRRWRTRASVIAAGIRLVKPLMKSPARPLLRFLYRLPKRLVQGNAATLFRMLGRRARRL